MLIILEYNTVTIIIIINFQIINAKYTFFYDSFIISKRV